MHADPLPVPDQPRGVLHSHDRRQAVLSRAITAPLVIRPPTSVTRPLIATNRGVQTGVRVAGDQDVARFEIGLRHVQDDAGPPLDGPGGNR
jgi:hypothetical protein